MWKYCSNRHARLSVYWRRKATIRETFFPYPPKLHKCPVSCWKCCFCYTSLSLPQNTCLCKQVLCAGLYRKLPDWEESICVQISEGCLTWKETVTCYSTGELHSYEIKYTTYHWMFRWNELQLGFKDSTVYLHFHWKCCLNRDYKSRLECFTLEVPTC